MLVIIPLLKSKLLFHFQNLQYSWLFGIQSAEFFLLFEFYIYFHFYNNVGPHPSIFSSFEPQSGQLSINFIRFLGFPLLSLSIPTILGMISPPFSTYT